MTFLEAHDSLDGKDGRCEQTALMDFKSEGTGQNFLNASPVKIYRLTGSDDERTDLSRTDGMTAAGVWLAFKQFSDAFEQA